MVRVRVRVRRDRVREKRVREKSCYYQTKVTTD